MFGKECSAECKEPEGSRVEQCHRRRLTPGWSTITISIRWREEETVHLSVSTFRIRTEVSFEDGLFLDG